MIIFNENVKEFLNLRFVSVPPLWLCVYLVHDTDWKRFHCITSANVNAYHQRGKPFELVYLFILFPFLLNQKARIQINIITWSKISSVHIEIVFIFKSSSYRFQIFDTKVPTIKFFCSSIHRENKTKTSLIKNPTDTVNTKWNQKWMGCFGKHCEWWWRTARQRQQWILFGSKK